MEKYGHGGDLVTASAVFGVSEDQLLDFSANINPLGPPEAVKRVLKEAEKIYSSLSGPGASQGSSGPC